MLFPQQEYVGYVGTETSWADTIPTSSCHVPFGSLGFMWGARVVASPQATILVALGLQHKSVTVLEVGLAGKVT